MARKPRKMMMFRFWLNQWSERNDEREAGHILFTLREEGQGRYTDTIRKGVRLVHSLERGDVSVLFELFPHIEALILSHKLNSPPPALPALPSYDDDDQR